MAYTLAWLARHGVREVLLNLHHRPDRLRADTERWAPEGLALHFSEEPDLLDTGGGIRRAATFLRESDPCLVVAGDMLLDLDLGPVVDLHRTRGDAATLVLRDDPRSARFGTIGLDERSRVCRVAGRFDWGGETRSGVYVSVNVIAARAFDSLPDREVFGHLDAWWAPLLDAGAQDIRGVLLGPEACVWEPVGTPAEYLAANLHPTPLSYLDADAEARRTGTRLEPDLVIGAGATIGRSVSLQRAVVWDGERVPDGVSAQDGVFAGGRFHACPPDTEPA